MKYFEIFKIFTQIIHYLVKEEEAARAVRKDKNVLSVEDVKKDFVKLQDQANYLEEKIVSVQKMTEANGIESKNKGEPASSRGETVLLISSFLVGKICGDVELLSEKVKNMSLTMKEDKFKYDDKLVKLGSQADQVNQMKAELDKTVSSVSQAQTKLEKTVVSLEDNSRSAVKDIQSIRSDLSTCKTSAEKCVKNVEDNSGKIFGCVHDCEMLKDNLGIFLTYSSSYLM